MKSCICTHDSLNDDDTASITSQESTNSKNKKRKILNGQSEIEDYYENRELPESKIASIDRALIRAFVCCRIPFSVIDSPFFPVKKELKLSENLTLEKISAEKFSAVVTDNAANVRLARELVTQEYPKILNLRCIAHFINVITKSILDHSIATKILAACNTIAKFFKTSHIGHNLLSECAKNLEIKGGGLKCFIKTRWTSMYEATYSIVRMKRALEEVMTKHPEKITNAVVNNLVGFQQHAIQAFNKRWEEFDISLYLLAYFLHPKFRTNGLKARKYSLITSAASRIWKSMGNNQNSCEDLYLQMRKYKFYLEPYNEKFKDEDETPILWWLSTDDTKKYLQELALHVLSVTPHSASCERVFSTLGWIYGKHRLRLQTSKVESMAKIRSFYISKVNDELRYASSKYSERELKIMVDESLNDIEEDFEDDEPERVLVEQHEIPNHIVSVLILEDIFDIKDVPFIKDPEDDDDDSESKSENEHEIDENNVDNVNPTEENDDNDYDVDALAAKYLD
uniref:HAT C-terminal dimerisation domain-containing protein n=1 Tax=Rhizophagus irregularis (strain DAOM 181602 / DAOM 197198 / MUCL 43194) TaxID=747089 RepID=U9U4N9_RHIID